MILSKSEILKNANYYIEYSFDPSTLVSNVVVSWIPNVQYTIQYDKSNQTLITNWNNYKIKINDIGAASMVWIIVNQICENYKYPIQYLQYKLKDNFKTSFIFDILHDEKKNAVSYDLFDLTQDLIKNGLNRYNVQMSKSLELWNEYKIISSIFLDLKIE